MKDIDNIIKECLRGSRQAQTKLVSHYAKKLLPVCKRYAPDDALAQDALQETFINTFRYLDKFQGKGVFDAWIRRIAVNCSLSLHKKTSFLYTPVDNSTDYLLPSVAPNIYSDMQYEELLELLKELPKNYYMVFTLYIIEGYDHGEIAEMLGIGESTSRSNLSRARQKIIDILKKKQSQQSKVAI